MKQTLRVQSREACHVLVGSDLNSLTRPRAQRYRRSDRRASATVAAVSAQWYRSTHSSVQRGLDQNAHQGTIGCKQSFVQSRRLVSSTALKSFYRMCSLRSARIVSSHRERLRVHTRVAQSRCVDSPDVRALSLSRRATVAFEHRSSSRLRAEQRAQWPDGSAREY